MFKKVEAWIVYLLFVVFLIITILFGALVRSYYLGGDFLKPLQPAAIFISDIPANFLKLFDVSNINESFIERSENLQIENESDLVLNGIDLNLVNNLKNGFILISGYNSKYDQPSIFLFDINKNLIIHEWYFDRGIIEDYNFKFQHPIMFENGELIFNAGEGSLIKVDACSNIIWKNDKHFHHSIEIADKNLISVPHIYESNAYLEKYLTGLPEFRDDGFAFVDIVNGDIVSEFSIIKILFENGYGDLATLGISSGKDPIHLNDAEPILISDEYVKKGDIMLSSRHLNFVALYRPSSNKVIFLKQGLFSAQHDLDYQGNGIFTFFGNDNTRYSERINKYSSIYKYDMKSDTVSSYQNLDKQQISLSSQGLHTIFEDKLFIDTGSAVYVLDENKKVYLKLEINLSEEKVGSLHWSRYYEDISFLEINLNSLDC